MWKFQENVSIKKSRRTLYSETSQGFHVSRLIVLIRTHEDLGGHKTLSLFQPSASFTSTPYIEHLLHEL